MSANLTATCPHCGGALVTEGLADGTTIVCARCRGAFEFRPQGDTRKISRKAVASLLLGLAAAVFSCLTAVPAIVLGVLALMDIRRREETLRGRRIALTGIAASLLLGTVAAPILLSLVLPAVQVLKGAK